MSQPYRKSSTKISYILIFLFLHYILVVIFLIQFTVSCGGCWAIICLIIHNNNNNNIYLKSSIQTSSIDIQVHGYLNTMYSNLNI